MPMPKNPQKQIATLSCSLDDTWWMTGIKSPQVRTHRPTWTELHRRFRYDIQTAIWMGK